MPKISEQYARQGHKDIPVLKILIYGLALSAIVWFTTELLFVSPVGTENGMVPGSEIEPPIE